MRKRGWRRQWSVQRLVIPLKPRRQTAAFRRILHQQFELYVSEQGLACYTLNRATFRARFVVERARAQQNSESRAKTIHISQQPSQLGSVAALVLKPVSCTGRGSASTAVFDPVSDNVDRSFLENVRSPKRSSHSFFALGSFRCL